MILRTSIAPLIFKAKLHLFHASFPPLISPPLRSTRTIFCNHSNSSRLHATTTTTMKETIKFYRQGDRYGEFSNFYYAPFLLDGLEWPTTEHYFQAQKFAHLADHEYYEMIRITDTPGNAARMGRNRSWPLRPDWEDVKDDVMRDCVLQKFLQHPDLAKVLLGTGDKHLIEHTSNDRYWADGGGDGKGKNMLGIILMEVRGKIAAMSPKGDNSTKEASLKHVHV